MLKLDLDMRFNAILKFFIALTIALVSSCDSNNNDVVSAQSDLTRVSELEQLLTGITFKLEFKNGEFVELMPFEAIPSFEGYNYVTEVEGITIKREPVVLSVGEGSARLLVGSEYELFFETALCLTFKDILTPSEYSYYSQYQLNSNIYFAINSKQFSKEELMNGMSINNVEFLVVYNFGQGEVGQLFLPNGQSFNLVGEFSFENNSLTGYGEMYFRYFDDYYGYVDNVYVDDFELELHCGD